jgi:O-antigen/teichoic acid export membrane protein
MAGAHARLTRAGRLSRGARASPGPAREPPGGAGAGNRRLAEVARGGTLNLAGAAASAIATLGITVLVTREFSKPVAGAFFTATSLFLIVEAVAGLGAYTGAVYFIARLRSLGEHDRIPVILRAAIVPVVAASVAAAAVLLLVGNLVASGLLGSHLGHGGAGPVAVAHALRVLALTLPFAALLDTFLGATRGYRDMRPTVLVDRLGRSAVQLLGVFIAVAAGSAALLAPLWAVPYVPAAVAAWLWLRHIRRTSGTRRAATYAIPPELAVLFELSTPVPAEGSAGLGERPSQTGRPAGGRLASRRLANANPRGFWRFTAPRALASLAQITIQRIDIVLVAVMRGPAEAAVYTAATRFLVAGQLGNAAISMAAQPRFTELFAVGDRRGANVVYQVTTGWLIILTWPLYLLAVTFGPLVLTVFGHSYAAGDTVMVILGLTMLLATACGQVDMVLTTTGRSSWSLANGLLAVSVNVGLDLFLIPRYGITGAAIGWAVAIVVTNLLPLAQVASVVGLHPLGRGALIAAALSGLSFGAVPLAIKGALGEGWAALLAAVAVGSALQVAGLWWFRGPLRLSVMPGLSAIPGLSSARKKAVTQ